MADKKTSSSSSKPSSESVAAPLAPPVARPPNKDAPARAGVSPAAVPNTPMGARHVRLLDAETGNELDPRDLFTDPEFPSTSVRTKYRVRQVYRHNNASTEVDQLLYPKGVQVPYREAQELITRLTSEGA
jgi:hypothetical protein